MRLQGCAVAGGKSMPRRPTAAELRAGIQKTQREGTQREGRGDVPDKTTATAPGEGRRRRRPATGEEEAAPGDGRRGGACRYPRVAWLLDPRGRSSVV